jgi:hypothetical protein
MVTDLTLSSLVGHPLEGLIFGGAPAPDTLVPRARKAFPTATMLAKIFILKFVAN